MNGEIAKSKIYAEHTLAYILNKLRNHDKTIKLLHEKKSDGWRKMKYPRGLFDRCIGFLSLNDINEEFISLTTPFHCKHITVSNELYNKLCDKYEIELTSCEELFAKSDIIIIQGDANDFKEKITSSLLDKIKDEALLVIVSDDVSFDEDALLSTLKSQRINALLSDKLSFAKDAADIDCIMLARI